MNGSLSDRLAKLRKQFTDQLPEKLNDIRTHFKLLNPVAWMPVEAEVLHRMLHSLTGTADTFGMLSVSDVSRALEIRLSKLIKSGAAPSPTEWQFFDAELKKLDQLARIRLESKATNLKPPADTTRLNHSPLIYLVEDDPVQAEYLSQTLIGDGYRVKTFTTTDAFRAACASTESLRPDAVIMDMIFPEGDNAGIKLMTEVSAEQQRCPPVIFVSVRDDFEARLGAFRAGASRYLVKPVDPKQLIDQLGVLTGRQPAEPYRVLMLDDDLLLLEAQAEMLRAAGMEVVTLSQPHLVVEMLNDYDPDVVVLDVYMPEASGPEIAAILRERNEQLHVPILFLSAETDMPQQLLALNLGGDDFLVKPVQQDHLVAAVTARARRYRQNNTIRRRLETTLYEREREHMALNHHAIVSIADRAGNIIYVNEKFCTISGYSADELMGKNHRILKSNQHTPAFYQNLWQTISAGNVWQGEVCNQGKDGSLYWVDSTITPFLDSDGIPYQYVSIRTDISALKESELNLRLRSRAMEASVNSILIADACASDTPLIYVNPAFEKLTGYSAGEVLGKNCRFLQGEKTEQSGLNEIRAAIREQRAGSALLQNFTKTGELFWNELTLAPVLNSDGVVTHFIGVINDVTARMHAEQELEASKERLRRGQLYANIGTWDWNIQTGELYWTERIAPLFGYPTGELETTYDNFLAAIHPDDRKAVTDAVGACIERNAPYEIEHRVVWPDGTVRWLLERGGVQRDTDGKPLQMLGVVQDVDDRKRAELALAEREYELRQAQKMSHIGNWSANMTTGELIWSDEIYRIFGYEPGSFTPSVEAFKATIHPDDRKLVTDSERLAEETGQHNVVHRIVRPDGSVRHVHELAQSETDADGRMIRLTGTVQDISEQVEAEQALIKASEEANRANKAKSDFLSSMSHELRTPMNAILGFGQLLQYDDALSAEQKDNVHEIIRAGDHLLELINEVLDLAKVESGRIDLSIEPIELCPIVNESINLIDILAEKRSIKVSHSGLKGVALRADRTRLKQVLVNLLSNAVKYNREGGSVFLDVVPHGADRIHIQVRDTGPGIPADKLEQIFQPFNRLDAENTTIEGTGIGLTITRRIVEMMGGTVDVKSEVGVGSTFWVELPIEAMPAPGQDGETRAATPATLQQTDDEAQHLLLYIEDNPSNLRLMAQILGRRKHIQLLTAHTPELGIELAQARLPELILLDINMPGMDGYQVLEILKAEPRLKNIPVIAVTANAMPRDIERGMAAGFRDYLTKPLDVARLYSLLDTHLLYAKDTTQT